MRSSHGELGLPVTFYVNNIMQCLYVPKTLTERSFYKRFLPQWMFVSEVKFDISPLLLL